MSKRDTEHTDDTLLDRFIDAVRRGSEQTDLEAATERFRQALPESRPRRAVLRSRLRLAGAAAMLLLMLGLLPQWIPGNGGAAFAEVQAWFESFRTAHVQTVMQRGDQTISRMNIWLNDEGAMRLEIDPIVHILNPEAGTLSTLLPGDQVMTVELQDRSDHPARDAMAWLDELRDFQGKAELLPESREIGGVVANGWRLQLDSMELTLWAEAATAKPMLLESTLPGGMEMRSILIFDEPVPDGAFRVPEGNRSAGSEE